MWRGRDNGCEWTRTNLVTIGIKVCFQIDDVWMGDKAHDLQFSVLKNKNVAEIPRESGSQHDGRRIDVRREVRSELTIATEARKRWGRAMEETD